MMQDLPAEFDCLLAEAGNEQTSGARLWELARADPKLALRVAQSPSAPPDLLEALSGSNDAARVNRGEINPLDATTQTSDSEIRSCVAANPNTPIDVLWRLGAEFPQNLLDNPVFLLLLLETPNLIEIVPEETLLRLFELETVPDYLCQQLLNHRDLELCFAIARSHNTSARVLELLARDRGNWVRPHSPKKLRSGKLRLGVKDVRCAVAQNRNTPANALQQLALDSESSVRVEVVSHPNTPTHLLEQLARDCESSVRVEVARNSKTPASALQLLAGDRVLYIRCAVAQNPNTPSNTLQQLIRDEDKQVRKLAAQTLAARSQSHHPSFNI